MAQTLVTSTTGSCAGTTGFTCLGSRWGDCCSGNGFCGQNGTYCGSGCQAGFGTCYVNADKISIDGSCGADANGTVCLGSTFGNCCSKMGFCGAVASYCGTGCQSAFGVCGAEAASASVSIVAGTASVATSSATSAKPSSTISSSSASASTPSSLTSSISSSLSSTSITPSSTTASSSTGMSPSNITSVSDPVQPHPVTASVGFKVGMAVAGVILAVVVGALIWFFVVHRRRQLRKGIESNKSEKNGPYFLKPELDSTVASSSELGTSQIVELPAGFYHKSALVDQRAAAGYEGAYRGH